MNKLTRYCLVWFFCSSAVSAESLAQLDSYEDRNDRLVFTALYYLPETAPLFSKHIPDHVNWGYFDLREFEKVNEETRQLLLGDADKLLQSLEEPHGERLRSQIKEWIAIYQQLVLLDNFLDGGESFVDVACADPLLLEAFKKLRPPDFDPKLMGSTLSSAENCLALPLLARRLLEMPEVERLECFSRFFQRVALERKKRQAEPK